jgi:hypothetical protein
MKTRQQYSHVIDAVFPIAVFFVFAASALTVLVLAAHIYTTTTTASDSHFTSRTAFAYIMEKVRQNDKDGGISIQNIQGTDCLALEHTTNDIHMTTYIYAYGDNLMELRVRDDIDFSLSDGSCITSVQDFEIQQLDSQLFAFTITTTDGQAFSMTFSERSRP